MNTNGLAMTFNIRRGFLEKFWLVKKESEGHVAPTTEKAPYLSRCVAVIDVEFVCSCVCLAYRANTVLRFHQARKCLFRQAEIVFALSIPNALAALVALPPFMKVGVLARAAKRRLAIFSAAVVVEGLNRLGVFTRTAPLECWRNVNQILAMHEVNYIMNQQLTTKPLIDAAREFVDRHVKTLPLRVQLSGITEAEKNEAASLCAEFASERIAETRLEIATELGEIVGQMPPSDPLVHEAWTYIDRLRGESNK